MSGDRCASACPERTGFEVAIIDTTPFQCAYCDTSLFLEFNHDVNPVGGCKCIDRYYEDANGDCQPCQDMLCKLCPPAGADCVQCVKNAEEDANGVCQCMAGFYASNGACV